MKISTVVEIPEELADAVTKFIEDNPKWSRDRLEQAALSLFLMQNGKNQSYVNSLHLESLLGYK